jgi:hypothetical protein
MPDSFGNIGFDYAFPRHYRDKEWEIKGLDGVYLDDGGSIRCLVKWKPTLFKSRALVGKAVQRQLEELFIEKYGPEDWQRRRLLETTPSRRQRI